MLTELTVHSVIEDEGIDGAEPEISITTHRANLRDDGGIIHLTYTDNAEDGAKITCRITVYEDDRITLSRRGAIVSDILFSEGEESRCAYSIPPYRFDMTVNTRKIRVSRLPEKFEIQIVYAFDIGGQPRRCNMRLCARR